jgi:hypothetical protein
MGLDWCIQDKVIPDMDAGLQFANIQLISVNEKIEALWKEYLEGNYPGQPAYGGVFPNPAWNAFEGTGAYLEESKRKKHWVDVRSKCVISPMETLGVPRIGIDAKATAYARASYEEAAPNDPELRKSYPTVEDYIKDHHGTYVPKLVDSPGIGYVTGMFAGAESFRGKAISYVSWLGDYGFVDDCYADREPEDLDVLGINLGKTADHFEANCKNITSEHKEDLKLVRAAADWCRFWAEEGHSMGAWY